MTYFGPHGKKQPALQLQQFITGYYFRRNLKCQAHKRSVQQI